jgi:GNAT superfamily N-acetyltransferase
MRCRPADSRDHPRLVAWNRELQLDEGAAPMEPAAIAARLERWLSGGYQAVVFETDATPIGYALFRPTDPDREGPGGLYLQQFFVARERRRAGLGSQAFRLFARDVLRGRRLLLDALETNPAGQAFWTSLGLRLGARRYELPPEEAGQPSSAGPGTSEKR